MGEVVQLRVRAKDPEGKALRFHWQAPAALLSFPKDTATSSEVELRVPVTCTQTITVIVEDSEGASLFHNFHLECALLAKGFTPSSPGAGVDFFHAVAHPSGALYVVGSFSGNMTLGGRHLSSSQKDIFVARLNSNGDVQWLHTIASQDPTETHSQSTVSDLVVAPTGAIYLAGSFDSQKLQIGTTTLQHAGRDRNAFVARLDATGRWQWVVHCYANKATMQIHGLTLDHQNRVWLTGSHGDQGRCADAAPLPARGPADIFVGVLDTQGKVQWLKSYGGPYADTGRSITADASGNLYLTGAFVQSLTWGETTLHSAGGQDAFIAKLDPSGRPLWAVRAGSNAGDHVAHESGQSITVQGSHLYVAGRYDGTADFGEIFLPTGPKGQPSSFVAQLSTDGSWQWVRRIFGEHAVLLGQQTTASSHAMLVHTDSKIYLTGQFSRSATFGKQTLSSPNAQDVFVTALDNQGNFLWVQQAGGAATDTGLGLSIDNNGRLLVSGTFSGQAPFAQTVLSSSHGTGGFLWWLKP